MRQAVGQVQAELWKTGPVKCRELSLSFLETRAKRETTLIVLGLSLSKEEKIDMFAKKSKFCLSPRWKETFISKALNKGQRTAQLMVFWRMVSQKMALSNPRDCGQKLGA